MHWHTALGINVMLIHKASVKGIPYQKFALCRGSGQLVVVIAKGHGVYIGSTPLGLLGNKFIGVSQLIMEA